MSTIFTIIIVAVVLWAVFSYLTPKLPEPIKTVVNIVVVLLAVFWLLKLTPLM